MVGSSSSLNPSLPARPAGKFPVDDENKQKLDVARHEHKEVRREPGKLTKWLLRISNEIEQSDREKRLNLFRQQIKAHQFMDGNFYGYVDQNCEWRPASRTDGQTWYSDNQLYPYFRTALMEMSRSQTQVVINAQAGARDEMVAAAKFAQARYDMNRDRTFNARLKQTENSYALLNGITYRYTFPSFNDTSSRKEKIPKILRPEGGEGESSKICAMCARPAVEMPDIVPVKGKKGDDQPCVNCGSDAFIEINLNEEPDTVIGYEELPEFTNAWIVPNPVGVIVSLQASCIEETPFIKWKQLILRSVLQTKFKNLELPSTGTESVELRYITNQQKQTPAGGHGDSMFGTNEVDTDEDEPGRELELLEFQQIWLDYSVYCNVSFDEDTEMKDGRTLKKGQKLGELYPAGLYYAKVGDLIVDIWNEDKNRKWTSSPYGMRPGSMYGSGSSAALSDQELINELKALVMAHIWNNAVPREFVDPHMITELSVDPYIPTTIKRQPGDRDFGYWQAPATQLSAEAYGVEDNAKSSMQNKIGAMSSGQGGLQDAQKWGDTATAISIKRDLAVGRFSPDLELMADQLDRGQAYQFLENEQQYLTPAQWEDQKGEYGDEALKAFLACDVRRDLVITIAPGSYMPKSEAQMQSKLMSFAQIFPALAQTQNPEVMAYASEVFGIPEYLGGWNSDREHARKVVNRFQSLAEMFIEQNGDVPSNDLDPVPVMDPVTGQPAVDPMTGQPAMQDSPAMVIAQLINEHAQMPVDVFLDNHMALEEAYRDWRATDDGREASNTVLAAVALRLIMHQSAIVKQQQMQAQMQMAAEAPMREAAEQEQAAMMEAQAGQQQQLGAQNAEQQQMEMANRLVDLNDKDEQRALARETQAAQHQHEKELEVAKILSNQAQQKTAAR